MEQQRPYVSIIVPTYNRASLLELTLKCIASQKTDNREFEVIVADDGSSDNTKVVVDQYARQLDVKYCFQEDKGYRVASVRNLGIEKSRGEMLIFLDSGMLVGSDFIEAHRAYHTKNYNVAVIGYVLGLMVEDGNHSEFSSVANDDMDVLISGLMRNSRYGDIREELYRICDSDLSTLPAPWSLFWTGNVSITRSSLSRSGVFDTNFDQRWGIEDVELGYRLSKTGTHLVAGRNAVGVHYPHFSDSTEKWRQEYINKLYMHQKHASPETEALLNSDVLSLNYMLTGRTPAAV